MHRASFPFLFSLSLVFSTVAQESPPSEGSSKPAVTKIGETRYRLGNIEFDSKSREIFIPAAVNMREGGPIEYLLVHENGKVHESIFVTAESPLNIQIILKLLGYKEGKGDLFNILLPPELLEKEGGKLEDRGDELEFRFKPTDGNVLLAGSETILDAKTGKAMLPGPWVYTGSTLNEGQFTAEVEGSIVAIYLDANSLFNSPREGADNDERWGANTEKIPEIGTKGTVTLGPRQQ